MTEQELAAIEKTWTVPNDGWNVLDVATDPDNLERHAANVLALVAEVRRLRGLIGAWAGDVLEVEGVEVRPEYTTNTDRLLKEAIDIGLGL